MSSRAFGYDPRLPEDIRDVFMWLCQDVASLQSKWSLYLGLFSSQENTALLSELAQSSFQTIEESLRADMTMAISRLTDPPQSTGKDNLSLRALVEQCSEVDGVPELLKDLLDACEPVRQHRKKRVAHNDLNTRIKPRDNPLPGIERSQIDRVLQLAAAVLNTIYRSYVDGELSFTPFQIGGADDMIRCLKTAKEHEAARRLVSEGSPG